MLVRAVDCTVPPLSLYLSARSKLWCTLQLRGQIHSPCFYSTPICTLCGGGLHQEAESENPPFVPKERRVRFFKTDLQISPFSMVISWLRYQWIHWYCVLASRVTDPDPYPDPHSNFGSGSGSRRAKMTHKNSKKSRILMFLSTGCSLLRAEGFSCSLGILYGGLGISKLQFLIKKIEIKFPAIHFFNFRSSNPGSGSGIRNHYEKCWIRILIRIRIKSVWIRNPVGKCFRQNQVKIKGCWIINTADCWLIIFFIIFLYT